MACFSGRNAGFTTPDIELKRWRPIEVEKQMQDLIERALDHGQGEHIVSVHLLKTLLAVRTEMKNLDADDGQILLAAITRFFESPLKRRQARRTAYQSLQFVAKE